MIRRSGDIRLRIGDPELAHGWPILVAAFLGMMFSISTLHTNTLGVLTPELGKAFGWSRSQVQASLAVMVGTFMLASPAAGMLINRFGARRVLLVAMPLLSVTFMAFALMRGSLAQFYALAALNACVGAGTLPMAFARVVTEWFPRRTGFALATALLGPGVLSVFSVPLVMIIVERFGWQGVYLIVGAMPLVMYPVVWLWLRSPPEPCGAGTSAPAEREGLGEALRQWRLWVMGFAFLLAQAAIGGCLTNLPTLLADGGLTRTEVMAVAPALGASAILGRLVGGRMLDRWWAPAVGLAFMLLLAGGLALLGHGALTPFFALAALVLIGFSNGVELDLLPYLVSRYFGLRAYASVYGVLYMFVGVGGGLAPILFSLARDLTGSFAVVLFAGCGAIALAGVALLALGPYRHFAPGAHPGLDAAAA